ncbi:MAG: Omp28-related outer membrane protein [Alistipes sp.]|nr:Omp28-related outer membrane protein [Alistipes sp.]
MKTIKLFAMFCAALVLCNSCLTGVGTDEDMNAPVKPQIPADGELVLTATPSTIVADGEQFSKLTLTKGGVEITEDFKLYDGKNQEVTLPDMKFTTTQKGKYEFWAAYGTDYTETITITATEKQPDAPEAPGDDNPDKLNFKRRVLLIQFTGTGCGYCPAMTATLRQVMAEEYYAENAVLVAAHRYNNSDPAYLYGAALDQAMGVSSYPQLAVDMHTRTGYTNYPSVTNLIINAINRVEARAGIAAVAEYDETTRTVSISATVKAGVKSEFRIGAWLIEDGVYGVQQNYGVAEGDFNIHDHCIRVADSKVTGSDFSGHTLGEIEAGSTADYSFSIKLESDWVADHCRLVLFVTSPETNNYGKSYFYVNNAVEMPIDGSIDFEYLDEE